MEVPIKVIVDGDDVDVNDGKINDNMSRRSKILRHNTSTTTISTAVTKSGRINRTIKNYNTVGCNSGSRDDSSGSNSSYLNVKGKNTSKRVYQTTDQYLASMQRVIDLSLLFLHEQAHVLFY